jgi:hypothetical protein
MRTRPRTARKPTSSLAFCLAIGSILPGMVLFQGCDQTTSSGTTNNPCSAEAGASMRDAEGTEGGAGGGYFYETGKQESGTFDDGRCTCTAVTGGTLCVPGGGEGGYPEGSVSDAPSDSTVGDATNDVTTVTGPTCGVARMTGLAKITASVYGGAVAIVAPGSTGATEVDTLADFNIRPPGIAVGACGDGSTTPPWPTGAIDVGSTVSFKDGATNLFDMSRITGNVYTGFGGVQPLPHDKPLTFVMASPTTVTPASVQVAKFPPNVVFSVPDLNATAAVPLIRGQPFTLTWTPPATPIAGLYIRFSADNKVCVLDPAAGTMTVPGSFSTAFTTGISGLSVAAVVADKAALTVNGTACALRTINVVSTSVQVDIQ